MSKNRSEGRVYTYPRYALGLSASGKLIQWSRSGVRVEGSRTVFQGFPCFVVKGEK